MWARLSSTASAKPLPKTGSPRWAPHIDAFEQEISATLGGDVHAAALSSGTAALHLALRLSGVGAGDEVLCSTFTFVAAANAITYAGATPVFVDSDKATWNMDPQLLADALRERTAAGKPVKAVVLVHLYGLGADMEPIVQACQEHGAVLIEDAAEARQHPLRPGPWHLRGLRRLLL